MTALPNQRTVVVRFEGPTLSDGSDVAEVLREAIPDIDVRARTDDAGRLAGYDLFLTPGQHERFRATIAEIAPDAIL